MERKELYAKIQELNLQDEVKKTYGKNYTQVGNSDLEKVIWNYDATQASKDPDEDIDNAEFEEADTCETSDQISTENPYKAACLTFLGILKDTGLLADLLAKL